MVVGVSNDVWADDDGEDYRHDPDEGVHQVGCLVCDHHHRDPDVFNRITWVRQILPKLTAN